MANLSLCRDAMMRSDGTTVIQSDARIGLGDRACLCTQESVSFFPGCLQSARQSQKCDPRVARAIFVPAWLARCVMMLTGRKLGGLCGEGFVRAPIGPALRDARVDRPALVGCFFVVIDGPRQISASFTR